MNVITSPNFFMFGGKIVPPMKSKKMLNFSKQTDDKVKIIEVDDVDNFMKIKQKLEKFN